jgi:superfamily II DNA or RNA helicase
VGKDGYKYRLALRDKLVSPNASKQEKSDMLKLITMHAVGAMRVMQQRKKFVNTHPKKIEIANKIIAARNDKKIITFSNTKDMAAQIGKGEVYTGKQTPKQCEAILNRFSTNPSGVLNTCAKVNEGLDVKGLSVAVILGIDSSKTKAIQRTGRVIRFEPGKEAEIFTLVIAGTVEANWFANSHPDKSKYITIDEVELEKVLNHEEFKTYQKPIPKMSFRF